VALFSLVFQGLTLSAVVRVLGLQGEGGEGPSREEQQSLDAELREAAVDAVLSGAVSRRDGEPFDPEALARVGERFTRPPDEEADARVRGALELRLAVIEVMRRRLEDLGRDGRFSTAALRHALAELDADQLSLELRIRGEE